MGLSAFLVIIGFLIIAYFLIMRSRKLKNEEIDEKIDETKKIGQVEKKINKVDINKAKKGRAKIQKFTEEF